MCEEHGRSQRAPGLRASLDLEAERPTQAELARYAEDPQLAILESYALDVVGELSPEEVVEVAEAVVGVFGASSDWRASVRQHFGWDVHIDAAIGDSWRRFSEEGLDAWPDPAVWARGFADEIRRRARS